MAETNVSQSAPVVQNLNGRPATTSRVIPWQAPFTEEDRCELLCIKSDYDYICEQFLPMKTRLLRMEHHIQRQKARLRRMERHIRRQKEELAALRRERNA